MTINEVSINNKNINTSLDEFSKNNEKEIGIEEVTQPIFKLDF